MKKHTQQSQDESFPKILSEENLFRNFVKYSSDAIFIVNKNNEVVYVSPACVDIFGYEELEFLNDSTLITAIIHPSSRTLFHDVWRSGNHTGDLPDNRIELAWIHKAGKTVFTENTFVKLFDSEQKVIGFQTIARNITKRKNAERNNDIFVSMGAKLSSAVTIQEAAEIVMDAANILFSWDSCTFDLYNSQKNIITSILSIDTIEGKKASLPPTITNTEPTPRMKRVLEHGGILESSSSQRNDGIMFGDRTRKSESLMVVPVRNRNKALGILSIQSYTENLYDNDSLILFSAVADFCGGALERIQARDALKVSEERFRGLFEHVPDGVYQSTKSEGLISVNKALANMLGYESIEELLSVDVARDLYNTPGEREQFIEILERNGYLRNAELNWKKRDGSPITLLENAHVVRDSSGRTLYYEGTLTDITELKHIEKALRESEHKYRVLIERMNEGVVQVDNDDNILFVNDRYCELVGYSREELIGKCAAELLHDEQGKQLIKKKNEMRTTGFSDKYEIPLRKKSGEIINVLISGSPVYDDAGTIVGSIGINLDITQRKKVAEELAAQKQFLRQIVDLNPNFIFAKDREGRFTLINQAMADSYGKTVIELLGKTDADFHQNDSDVARFRNDDVEVMNSLQEKFIPEELIETLDGVSRWVQTIKRPIVSADGIARQVLGVATDITTRKKAEDAFRQSELRFRRIFEDGPIGMAIIATDLNVLDVNNALCRMLGYRHDELTKLPIFAITHPEDYEKDLHLAQKALNGEIPSYSIEKRYIRKDKTILWGKLTGSVVWDIDGNALYGIGMVEDITERKRTEELLRLLESAVRQANESITITSSGLDEPEPRIVYVNPAFTKMTGYTLSEVIGKTPRILQGPKTERTVLDDLRKQLSAGEEFHGEIINYKKDGSEFFLEWHVVPIKDDNGLITHFLAVQRDVTERKKADEDLRKSEKRYRLFFEEDLTGDFIALPDGAVIECNNAYQGIFGFENHEQALQFNLRNLFPQANQYDVFLERVKNERKLTSLEMEFVRPDGKQVFVIQNIIGIFGKEGDLRRFKGYVFDNTERKRLEKQLLHSQKMESIGTLAAGLAHNFNNIMSIILGYATSLRTGSASPSKVADSVAAISLAVKRGTGLVRQLTTFARSTEPILMSVNLNTMIQEMERIIRETFPESIRCEVELNHESSSILADPNQLHQTLLNLCVNARDAMPDGGRLIMQTSIVAGDELRNKYPEASAERYICITITDTGVGFDKTTRDHIFEPFFTTKDIGKGTGLGLSVVYGIVKNHKGFIDVESELSRGTIFSLYFEAQPGIEKFIEEEQEFPGDIRGGDETLLVVEDEEMLLDLVKSLLEIKGYTVYAAKDGEEAVDLLNRYSNSISLILTDMGLPKVGGWDLLKIALNLNPNIKVILASGYLDSELHQHMIESGASDFIQKPYEPDFILTKIRDVLDKKN